jgi:hypothetical protein
LKGHGNADFALIDRLVEQQPEGYNSGAWMANGAAGQEAALDGLMRLNQMRQFSKHRFIFENMWRSVSTLSLTVLLCSPLLQAATTDWRTVLEQELPLLGHRNWIVIVDSAYPLQSSPGVETIETDASQDEVVRTVLGDLSRSKHVAPDVYMDAELPFVPEQGAPGVTAYRTQLPSMLGSLPVRSLPHEQLIKMLADAGTTFHILVLKTTLTIPYTSVFLRLDCKYWDAASEAALRKAMGEHMTQPK